MMLKKRLIAWASAASVGFVAVAYGVVGGEKTDSAPVRTARAHAILALDKLEHARTRQSTAELFAVKSWYVAPPPPPPAPPPPPPPAPPPPTAPPLPFTFMGRMNDGERLSVFLVKDSRVHVVFEGDVIEEIYRLEKVEPRRLTFRYLPLDSTQTLIVKDNP